MADLGKTNRLIIVKAVSFGLYLDGGELGEILLPIRYVPEGVKPGDELEVFLYKDSEDRIIATTEIPKAKVGNYACLEVIAVNSVGAFMDWGLSKDLLIPFREQKFDMKVGESYVVKVIEDSKSDRIYGTTKFEKYFEKPGSELEEGQEVQTLIYEISDMGYKCIINQLYQGLIYKNEVFTSIFPGETHNAYIKKLREDGKIDVTLNKTGYGKTGDNAQDVLFYIHNNGGNVDLTDKSPAEVINDELGISKKAFKMALGFLYKNKWVLLKKGQTEITDKGNDQIKELLNDLND